MGASNILVVLIIVSPFSKAVCLVLSLQKKVNEKDIKLIMTLVMEQSTS